MRNVFGSEHSVGVGADLSCPYPRNCKKIYCVVRWFHSAIMVRGDEEEGAMNRSPTPVGVFRGYFVGECWVFTECFVVISWVFVALLTIRSQRNGRLLVAVGADLSCPHIYIRHAFAIRLKHIYVMFATCSLSVCYIFAV